jgi:wyosine [tRNA(Phe)-imidazoG37] synthetase (radical SAM superfamily)
VLGCRFMLANYCAKTWCSEGCIHCKFVRLSTGQLLLEDCEFVKTRSSNHFSQPETLLDPHLSEFAEFRLLIFLKHLSTLMVLTYI